MSKILGMILALVTVPIVIFRIAGWFACAIWLLCIGDWGAVVASLIIGYFGGVAWLLLSGACVSPIVKSMQTTMYDYNKYVSGIVSAQIVQTALTIVFCGICIALVLYTPGTNESTFAPRLLMSYCVSVHTIMNFVTQDQEKGPVSDLNILCVLFVAIGFLVAILAILLFGVEWGLVEMIICIACFAVVAIFLSFSSLRGEPDVYRKNLDE